VSLKVVLLNIKVHLKEACSNMGFLPVIEYMIGIGFFGFSYWFLNGIKETLENVSEQGNLYELCKYVWVAILIIYLIFGGIWLVRKYTEQEYTFGG